MNKKLFLIILIFMFGLCSCYNRYKPEFEDHAGSTNRFSIVKDSIIDFYFSIYGSEYRKYHLPFEGKIEFQNEYKIFKDNASLDFYFLMNRYPSVLIKDFHFSILGITKNDTVSLRNGLIIIDVNGESEQNDIDKNRNLKFSGIYYTLRDTIPIDSGLCNYYYPINRDSYCDILFRINFKDSRTPDIKKYFVKVLMDFNLKNKDYHISKSFDISSKIESRLEIGVH